MQRNKKLKKIQIKNPTVLTSSHDVYHFMLSLSTAQFLLCLFLIYILINMLFAICYIVFCFRPIWIQRNCFKNGG